MSSRPRSSTPLALRLLVLLGLLASIPAGCRPRTSSTWTCETGHSSLELRSDGTAYLTTFGGTVACTYEVDGDRVLVKGPSGTQILTRIGDRLEGGLGMTFVRR